MTESTKFELKETGGKGYAYFALIPALLAGAALMWLAFFTGIVDWRQGQNAIAKQATIEGRMDNRVGVNGTLTKPVDLIITNHTCLKIERAFLDGTSVTMYLHNQCHSSLEYYEWHWKAIAPDGTIIGSNYANDDSGLDVGDKAEKTMTMPGDPRIEKVIVWAKNDTN
jgi:hypothetical protein